MIVRETTSNFEPAPEGLSQCVCVDIVDLGMVQTQYGDKHMVRLVWQLPSLDKRGERHTVSGRYTVSLHAKSRLRQHLEMWRGKKFTAEELGGFDLEKLIGANGQVQIVHNIVDDGKVYANVQALVPVMPGSPRLVPVGYTRVKDRTPGAAPATSVDDNDDIPF